LRVVDAIAGAYIDLELRDAICEITMLARIAIDQSIDANQDAGSSRAILESVDPVSVLVGLLDTHGEV
jgi:hypothetical protein